MARPLDLGSDLVKAEELYRHPWGKLKIEGTVILELAPGYCMGLAWKTPKAETPVNLLFTVNGGKNPHELYGVWYEYTFFKRGQDPERRFLLLRCPHVFKTYARKDIEIEHEDKLIMCDGANCFAASCEQCFEEEKRKGGSIFFCSDECMRNPRKKKKVVKGEKEKKSKTKRPIEEANTGQEKKKRKLSKREMKGVTEDTGFVH